MTETPESDAEFVRHMARLMTGPYWRSSINRQVAVVRLLAIADRMDALARLASKVKEVPMKGKVT